MHSHMTVTNYKRQYYIILPFLRNNGLYAVFILRVADFAPYKKCQNRRDFITKEVRRKYSPPSSVAPPVLVSINVSIIFRIATFDCELCYCHHSTSYWLVRNVFDTLIPDEMCFYFRYLSYPRNCRCRRSYHATTTTLNVVNADQDSSIDMGYVYFYNQIL